MSLSLNSLRLLQAILLSQQVSMSAPEAEIRAVLAAKQELAEAIEQLEKEAPDGL